MVTSGRSSPAATILWEQQTGLKMTEASHRNYDAASNAASERGVGGLRWRDVLAILRDHDVAVPCQQGLAAIQSHARDLFLNCLSALDTTANEKAVVALRSMLYAVSGDTIALLASHNLVVSHDELAMIAGVRPRLLSEHLESLKNGDSAARLAGLNGVRALLPGASGVGDPMSSNRAANGASCQHVGRSEKRYASVHVYGANYALCFNVGSRTSVPGIMLDAAVCVSAGYDWAQAIHVWLSVAEVGELLAVLRRWRKSLILANHGRSNEKSFEVHQQGDHLFARVSVRSRDTHSVRGVRLHRSDAQSVAMACIQVLRLAHPELPIDEVLNCLRDVHGVGVQSSALGHPF